MRKLARIIDRVWTFFSVAARDIKNVGTLFPSSRAAGIAIAKYVPTRESLVVEYGSGTGAIVGAILDRIDSRSHLIGVEINKDFFRTLKKIADPRFKALHQEVSLVARNLKNIAKVGVDAVVSGIPFSVLPVAKRERILRDSYRGLKQGGVLILYQYSTLMYQPLKRVFKNVEVHFEPRNFPPYFIMVATKSDQKPSSIPIPTE